MRFIAIIGGIALLLGLIYKWRYRVMNVLLAIGIVRQLAISFTMKLPQFRNKLAPALFGEAKSNSAN